MTSAEYVAAIERLAAAANRTLAAARSLLEEIELDHKLGRRPPVAGLQTVVRRMERQLAAQAELLAVYRQVVASGT